MAVGVAASTEEFTGTLWPKAMAAPVNGDSSTNEVRSTLSAQVGLDGQSLTV